MAESWRETARTVATELSTIFGARLRSVLVYGPHIDGDTAGPLSLMALVGSLTIGDLDRCASRAGNWRRASVGMPLILPIEEFRQSLDAFPLEYGEILRAHDTVFGEDLLSAISISTDDLRRACETQVKSHLLHLRESYMEAGGNPTAIADLVMASAGAFTALLRNVARLSGVHVSSRMEATLAGARVANLPEQVIADVVAMERPRSVPQTDAARLFPEYLAAVEQLAHAVDTWRAA